MRNDWWAGLGYSLLPRNLTGTAQTAAKTLKVACLREQTEIFWTRRVPILSVDARCYLCNVGRKTEGWLLFASIRNEVTAGGLEAARSNSRTATTAETAGGCRQLSSNSRRATRADILAAEYQLRSVDRHKTMLELLSVSLQVISVSLLLPTVSILQGGSLYEDILAEAVCSAVVYFSVMPHKDAPCR